ncbi:hypothetical protein [Sphingosinicella sp. CPCC 101087]|uniref:hypothetical protein n=1 Tax=Sphingosinicella sp. CPCC 101087 TaxID=2497754 RepID=UPI00101CCDE0|nr:hypothetical protein [Sphingosinicella sp. CPCC 101087]
MKIRGNLAAAAAGLALSFTVSPALAQSRAQPVEQIGGSQASDAAVGQIGVAPRSVRVPLPPAPTEPVPVGQISAAEQSRGAPTQLTRESGSGPAPAQLYRGGRTAQPAEALSSPSEGRTGAVARVEGNDACDPAAEGGQARGRVCEQVIETRASEFERAEPVVSAEQKLLMEQRLREQAVSAESAARRLATHGGNPDSLEEQGIASLVLRDVQPPAPPNEESPPEQTSPIIEAIVGAMTGTPPQ